MPIIISMMISLLFFIVAILFGSENVLSNIILSSATIPFNYIIIKSISNNSGITSIMVGIYFVYAFIFPGMLHSARNTFPFYYMSYVPQDIIKSSVVVMLFSYTLMIGFIYRQKSRDFHICEFKEIYCFSTFSIISMIIISIIFMAATGPEMFLLRRIDAEVAVSTNDAYIILYSCRSSAIIALAAALHRYRYIKSVPGIMLLMFCFAYNAFVNNPSSMARFSFFGFCIIIIVCGIDFKEKIFKMTLSAVMIIGFITLFPYLSFLQRGDNGAVYSFDLIEYYSLTGDFDGLQSTIDVVKCVDGVGLTWGLHLLSALFVFIPRTIWTGKAWPTGVVAGQYAGFPFTNLSSPIPSELFIDFGWVGVFIGAFFIGRLLAYIDNYKPYGQSSSIRELLYVGGSAGFCIILARGALQGVSGFVIVFYALSYLYTSILPKVKATPNSPL